MMKLNVKNVDVWNVVECEEEFDVVGSELKKSGMYRFECGSRGVLESVEYLGDVDEIEVEDVDDVNKMYVEWYKDEDDVSEEDVKNIVDEWYVCEEMDGLVGNGKKYWVVGWNEEDSVCYVKVNVEEKFVMDLFEIRESIKESVYGSCDYITKLDIKLWMEEVNTSKYFGLGTEVDVDWLYEELKQLNN